METKAYKPVVRELASRIYVDLVVRSASVTEHGVKMIASAENIARLSFGLAEAFQAVENDLNVANLPKTGFDMEKVDLTSWNK